MTIKETTPKVERTFDITGLTFEEICMIKMIIGRIQAPSSSIREIYDHLYDILPGPKETEEIVGYKLFGLSRLEKIED